MDDMFPTLQRGENIAHNSLEIVSKRAEAKHPSSLNQAQLAKCNSHLCGQHPNLQILPMSTVMLNKQILATTKMLQDSGGKPSSGNLLQNPEQWMS
jgi:uncharacterized protein YcfL